jgi:hypothetical protein
MRWAKSGFKPNVPARWVPLVSSCFWAGTLATVQRLSHMGATDHKKLGSRRRKLLTQRLREYFAELRADLETDSEAFFRNVMARTEHSAGAQNAPRHRRD